MAYFVLPLSVFSVLLWDRCLRWAIFTAAWTLLREYPQVSGSWHTKLTLCHKGMWGLSSLFHLTTLLELWSDFLFFDLFVICVKLFSSSILLLSF